MLDAIIQGGLALGSFILVALAARSIGKYFSSFGLPYITGYLLAGMVAGPFILGLMSSEDTTRLRFIDELSLAVIAFIAGSELYLKELRNRLRSIALNTAGVVAVAPILIGSAIFIATQFIPFTADMPVTSRIAVAVLGATILLALSPASTIAVIQEVRARGDFTKTILSITVVMDVVIIVMFAITGAFAAALITGSALDVAFVVALALDLALALASGVAVGKTLEVLLSSTMPKSLKTLAVLVIGLAIFVISLQFTNVTKALGLELHLEPLLISMIAGFYVTNFTRYRDQFDGILHDVSPLVYVAFFTLTGVALKLDILIATGGVAVLLFLVRMFSIFLGSYVGGTLAKEPPLFRRNAWLGLITQAGIALGLAREVAVEFPTLGDAFATLIISVVVLNEVFGPLFLKYVLRRVGEAHTPDKTEGDGEQRVAIFGVEAQSVALARQLQRHDWHVVLIDTDKEHVERFQTPDVAIRHVAAIDECLADLFPKGLTALVTLLENDADSLTAATVAYEFCGVKQIVVRLNELAKAPQFASLGALVVNPTAAMVNLLDTAVRAPQQAALLLHADPEQDVAQVTVTNRDIDGMLVRDLRLPSDVLILGIMRNGHNIVPDGYSNLHLYDGVTLIGSTKSVQAAARRLGM